MHEMHTRGTWRIEDMEFPHQPRVHCDEGGKDKLIACVGNAEDWEFASAEWLANAHLIAAAPELLAALKAMLPENNNDERLCRPNFETCEKARDAIAKAEGLS